MVLKKPFLEDHDGIIEKTQVIWAESFVVLKKWFPEDRGENSDGIQKKFTPSPGSQGDDGEGEGRVPGGDPTLKSQTHPQIVELG